jgi:hypothetical protein
LQLLPRRRGFESRFEQLVILHAEVAGPRIGRYQVPLTVAHEQHRSISIAPRLLQAVA